MNRSRGWWLPGWGRPLRQHVVVRTVVEELNLVFVLTVTPGEPIPTVDTSFKFAWRTLNRFAVQAWVSRIFPKKLDSLEDGSLEVRGLAEKAAFETLARRDAERQPAYSSAESSQRIASSAVANSSRAPLSSSSKTSL